MDVNATIDVGKNLTSLLERLAQQIGTTADKVFPWYVQQAQLEGVTALVAVCALLVISTAILAISLPIAVRDGNSVAAPVAFVSGLVLLAVLGIGTFESVEAVRKISNPNYYAMKMLTQDIGRLVPR
jgi:hypothetical protein